MATPFPKIAGRYQEKNKDNYNCYHLQVQSKIECVFGMMVQRWGILRMAMPRVLGIVQIIALLNSLAKLHNFSIGEITDSNESSEGKSYNNPNPTIHSSNH